MTKSYVQIFHGGETLEDSRRQGGDGVSCQPSFSVVKTPRAEQTKARRHD